LLKLTELSQEASKGFDPNDMGQLMKFLHALQAQALIAQRAAALMGEPAKLRGGGRGVGEERRLLSGGLAAVQSGGGV
jgi:hypothetical protein